MTSELLAIAPTGATLYAVLLDEAGQAYRAGHSAEAPASAHWADYVLAMTEASTTFAALFPRSFAPPFKPNLALEPKRPRSLVRSRPGKPPSMSTTTPFGG